MGSAIYSRVMQYIVPENFQTISIELDSVNTAINGSSFASVYGEAMKQAILVSLKEMYGWVYIIGVLFLALILFEKFLNRNIVGRLPRIRRIKHIMKRENV